jgi:hypothetical protein
MNTITSPHLRRALSKWAEFTNRADPTISVPNDDTSPPRPEVTTSPPEELHEEPPTLEPPKEWDPLPPSLNTPPIIDTAPLDSDLTLHGTPPLQPKRTPKLSGHSRKQRKLLSVKDNTSPSESDAEDVLLAKERKWADDGMEKKEEVGGITEKVKKLFGGWL